MNCNGPSELECTSCGVSQDLFMPPSATTLSPVAPHVGQCVKCCKDDNVVPGQCCDCSKPGECTSANTCLCYLVSRLCRMYILLEKS